MKRFFCETLENILIKAGHETGRERGLAQELADTKNNLNRTSEDLKRVNQQFLDLKDAADERLAMIEKAAALADERAVLLQDEAAKREKAMAEVEAANQRVQLAESQMLRLRVELEALQRAHERDRAELAELSRQVSSVDASGSVRALQTENAGLRQRVEDLQTYIAVRGETAS